MSGPLAYARRIGKWTGLVLTSAILIAYPVVTWFFVMWSPTPRATFWLCYGCLTFDRWSLLPRRVLDYGRSEPVILWGWMMGLNQNGLWSARVPLWSLALAAAIPTALLWRADRRAKRIGGCVNCGYDLTGLPADGGAAVCPECGRARPTRAAD